MLPISSSNFSPLPNPFLNVKPGNDFLSNEPDRNLSELLPSAHKDPHSTLAEYALLLVALLNAMEHLELGELNKFDALVKENLCQVRAIINLLLRDDCLASLPSKRERVKAILSMVEE